MNMERIIRNIRWISILLASAFMAFSCSGTIDTDVLIVGGGASGISAGIQSARMGVRTMVVEETPWVGGMLTSAGVSCVDGNYNLRSGIFGEFADSLAARYGGYDSLKTGWVSNINFDPQVGQEVLASMAAACGPLLDLRRSSKVVDIKGGDGKWTVIVEDGDSGRRKVRADVLIDATELGDIAKACGVAYRKGMESSSDTGESIAPQKANDVIQDLTYVAFLKDYGPDADMTIPMPQGYDPALFADSCINPLSSGVSETGQTVWPADMMLSYGKTPGGRYMINWPIYGNDYYVDVIDASPQERAAAYEEAKNFTLCFVYFIQDHLGMRNLGIADDVFPTGDGLPFFPYHRESRRIVGESFFTMDAAARPYEYEMPYYRTGIAVGDYPVDHHHFRHPQWRSLPDLHFYPIPSFNVPLGVMLPLQSDVRNLIVAEKSLSVSNLINGATRLQPVVMQVGQAAGALAALAVTEGKDVKEVGVRQVQEALLNSGCYLMPYLDLPSSDRHFKALQRVGATGVMHGEGRNVGWTNQTWFRAEDPLLAGEIYLDDYLEVSLSADVQDSEDRAAVSIGELLSLVKTCGGSVPEDVQQWWQRLDLNDFQLDRTASRLEAAVVLDSSLDLFGRFEVDYEGNVLK